MYMLITIMKLMMIKETKYMIATNGCPQLPFGKPRKSGSQSGGVTSKGSNTSFHPADVTSLKVYGVIFCEDELASYRLFYNMALHFICMLDF